MRTHRRQLSAFILVIVLAGCASTSSKDRGAVLSGSRHRRREELIEAITHLAFYAGWPKVMAAMAAMTVAKRVFRGDTT
jgi:4-carboxymuconolactone decarboxylase